jgi:putative oxidoreductase
MNSFGLCLLRLALAVVLVAHGAHKLFGMWAGPGVGPGGLNNTAAYFQSIDLQPAFLLAVVAGVAQLLGGALIGLGALTRYASALGLMYIGVGMWKAHWKWGLFLNWTIDPGRGHGIEYALVIAGALFCLLFTGPGEFSIDGQRATSRASRAAGRARLRQT